LEKPTFSGEILVFEDNTMNQQVITEHLTRVGIKAVIAENGKIGVDKVKSRLVTGEKLFDLIFMDIHMPVMDGLEAAAIIHSLNIETPVVAMTANIMPNDRELYSDAGMIDYLGKPFTSQELWKCLSKYLKPSEWKKENSTELKKTEDEFWQKLLNLFVKNYKDKFIEIEEALETGDIELAHRIVHTLKGNAAQLKFTGLQQAAGEVEDSLKNKENNTTKEQLITLKEQLDAVLAQIVPLVTEPDNQQAEDLTVERLDTATELELIKKLQPMLASGNPQCLELIEELRSIPNAKEVIKYMEDFDFKQALEALKKIIAL
jgi:CheY-like chemotaxis protein